MDDLTVNTNAVKNAATSTPNGHKKTSALAGLAGSFQDLFKMAGIRFESGLSALIDRAGLRSITERAEAARPAEYYDRPRSDDGRDRINDHARAGDDKRLTIFPVELWRLLTASLVRTNIMGNEATLSTCIASRQ